MFRHWFGRPSAQYSQAPHGRLGETATRSPTASPSTPVAERHDPARHLVAEDHRLAQPHGAEAAMVEVVQVGAADAPGLDRYLDFAGARCLGVALLDAQVLRGVDDDGAHR